MWWSSSRNVSLPAMGIMALQDVTCNTKCFLTEISAPDFHWAGVSSPACLCTCGWQFCIPFPLSLMRSLCLLFLWDSQLHHNYSVSDWPCLGSRITLWSPQGISAGNQVWLPAVKLLQVTGETIASWKVTMPFLEKATKAVWFFTSCKLFGNFM